MSVPTVPSRSGMRREVHPVGKPVYGECKECNTRFDDLDNLDRHMAEEHPVQCSSCNGMAAYRTARGSRYSGTAYCVEHMRDYPHPEPYYVWNWVTEPANDDAPRLPEDHPIEVALRGLYGSREQAQEVQWFSGSRRKHGT